MSRPSITVLTDPAQVGRYFISEKVRSTARHLRNWLSPRPAYTRSPYRGHFAVTRSLVEGLQKIGVRYTYNPARMADVGEVVVVLSGLDALRQAIHWKQSGRIRYLLAGPNLLVFPSEHADLIAAPEVDVCLTPAQWVCEMYVDDCPELRGRCVAWPAGVDTSYWTPSPRAGESTKALIFDKQAKGPVGPISAYIPVLDRRGYQVEVITYGKYLPDEYLRMLRRSCLMVGFVTSESQGLAWAEAWSTDVPTLLWFQDHDTYQGRTFASSTAPYLLAKTGLFFSSLVEFEMVLTQWESTRQEFQPRQWVLENMSDEVCARQLCDLAGVA